MTAPEAKVESYLLTACADRGILCLKFTSPGNRAVPDRILFGHRTDGSPMVLLVEVKAPGEQPRDDQRVMARRLGEHGAIVRMVDRPEAVDALLAHWFAGQGPDCGLLPEISPQRPVLANLLLEDST